jgi:cardiolipin synthase
MTVANQITIARILLIPIFVLFSIYYGKSVVSGSPLDWQRLVAIGVFILAACTDGIDGYVARRWNQRSRLGALLDPIADKGLLLTAIITLSLTHWTHSFPMWFAVLVIARDALILLGCGLLHFLHQNLEIRPSMTGKAATALQMLSLAMIMLQLPSYLALVYVAGIFTFISGAEYLIRGISQLRHNEKIH